jgi:hypothetical protein
MFDGATAISITLQAAEWNEVIAALIERPYRIAAPLIQKIGEQAQALQQSGGEESTYAPD